MPKRQDLHSILIIGAGPIVIGQACEFDYAGAQACKALREEGYRIVLVNSNPATIMTDPNMADAVYIEPICWKTVARIIDRERPDALLPTVGGQTALNCALDLYHNGVLKKYNVEMIGASPEVIHIAEDRGCFRKAMQEIGIDTPISVVVNSVDDAFLQHSIIGFPTIIRPSFTLGGSGGGIAYNRQELAEIVQRGLALSPVHQVLLEKSVLGWKEFEMEVMRDCADNCIIVCSIENLDPMGVHTGDSITVAPAQTLTDKEYQIMRNAALSVLRKVGVNTGGANVQFAINPQNGHMSIIEMNPRVSRSSALVSKATGFPIAKIAAKLAVGYTLDELKSEMTGHCIPISFEPSIDYVVTKVPRFNFEKFPQANPRLTTQMQSVGEVMAIGRTFQESLQKALRGLETGSDGFNEVLSTSENVNIILRQELGLPGPQRLWFVAEALQRGFSIQTLYDITNIDPWFLLQIEELVQIANEIRRYGAQYLQHRERLYFLKRKGFSDSRLATLASLKESDVRQLREAMNIHPVYKQVDSCAAEFATSTAYLYSTYEEECEVKLTNRNKIIVLGGGPNRIGQGIEFDYCCVHAALALREDGYETIMVNCNPETVSTDIDISDKLYFEPLTLENVLEIVRKENPLGVIVQYGGQTPLRLAGLLAAEGVPIIGTNPDAIDRAEDRERFRKMIEQLGLRQPPNRTAKEPEEAVHLAKEIGYPLVVRPSYVLGGRAMEIVQEEEDLRIYMREAMLVSSNSPVLLDRFLCDAVEVDIDAVSDGHDVIVCGIMEHIEEAGVHSGDSACSLPPYSLNAVIQQQLRVQVQLMALELGVVGLMNAQFAIQGDDIYVLEVNPRASRTVPYVSKATGRALAQIAARCMVGQSLRSQNIIGEIIPKYYSVKEAVFPFVKFPGVDPLLGPEMKSTGEVMGIGRTFGEAFAKAQLAAGEQLPVGGRVFISVKDSDKLKVTDIAIILKQLGFTLSATSGTAAAIHAVNLECQVIHKVGEGRPNIVDLIKNNQIHLIINTTEGKQAIADSFAIRREALMHKISYTTTIAAARATCQALRERELDRNHVNCLQDLHRELLV